MNNYSDIKYSPEQVEHVALMLKEEKEQILACFSRMNMEIDFNKFYAASDKCKEIIPTEIQEALIRLEGPRKIQIARIDEYD